MSENRQAIAIAMGILMAVSSTTAVGLRLLARRRKRLQLAADDYTIIGALIFTLALCVDILIGASVGKWGVHEVMGLHGGGTSKDSVTSAKQLVVREKTLWIMQLLVVLAPGLTKLSVLLLYRRIFLGKVFRVTTWILLVFSSVWTISFFFGNLFLCTPIQAFWDSHYLGKVVYIRARPFFWAQVISDVILDALILTLPWYPVAKLQMPFQQKLSVCGIFLLGGFVVAAGIVRCTTLKTGFAISLDHSYTRCPGFYWAVIEAGTGVISACLPTLRPVISKPGPESIIRSVQRRIMNSWSRTRLTKHHDTDDFIRASSIDDMFVSSGVYEGRTKGKAYQTNVEVTPMRTLHVPTDGIAVQSTIRRQEELV